MKRTIQHFYNLDKGISQKMVADAVISTKRAPSTIYMWMRGERVPCHLEQVAIQKIVQKYYELVPLSELFSE